jgi:phosphoenolpyruvate carboxykinase (ATP)
MLHAALSGALREVPTRQHPVFGVAVPQSCPDVPDTFLDARDMWADKEAYDRAAADLAGRFRKNFERFGGVAPEVARAAPGA